MSAKNFEIMCPKDARDVEKDELALTVVPFEEVSPQQARWQVRDIPDLSTRHGRRSASSQRQLLTSVTDNSRASP